MNKTLHQPVMCAEVLEYLQASGSGCYLDCTLGGAGHTQAILDANPDNQVFACDRDQNAIARAEVLLKDYADRVQIRNCAFSEVGLLFQDQKFNGIIADLGLSSDQLSEERGFSFEDQTSLDMRMDQSSGTTAADIVNKFSQSDLTALLKRGGVKQKAYHIAEEIIKNRPFDNAKELASVINKVAVAKSDKKINPATIAFQAIRIEVNDELNEIENLMKVIPRLVSAESRLVMISFHSLEDKLVTSQMRKWSQGSTEPALWKSSVQSASEEKIGRLLTKDYIQASDQEIESNPRARSARLRCFEFSGE